MKYNKLKKKIVNLLMVNGNKKTSENLLVKIKKKIQKNFYKKNCKDLVKIGLINSSPILFFKSIKRKRKKTIKFPFLLNSSLRIFYGLKFILKNGLYIKKKPSYIIIQTELIESANNRGSSAKKKKRFT